MILLRENIQNEVYELDLAYDMTSGAEWRGFLEKTGEKMRTDMCGYTAESQEETEQFLADIMIMIENIRELIRELEEKIAYLEAQMCSLQK